MTDFLDSRQKHMFIVLYSFTLFISYPSSAAYEKSVWSEASIMNVVSESASDDFESLINTSFFEKIIAKADP